MAKKTLQNNSIKRNIIHAKAENKDKYRFSSLSIATGLGPKQSYFLP